MVRRRFVALIALSAALFAADLSEAAETGPRVQETVLQNGLKVLVVEEPKAPVYADRRLMTTLKGGTIVKEFIAILDEYVDTRFRS